MALTREERVLVEGCRAGDEQAWLALFRAYASDVGLYLKAMLRDANEIDDLVQKVFLEFLASLARFRGDAGIRTWLHRIARHVALHEIRSSQRRARYVRSYADTVDRDEISPEGQISARLQLARIEGILNELDESFREVWVLRELLGMSVADTATVLEIRPATVRTRHHRVRQRLLALLQQSDDSEAGEPDAESGPARRPELKLVSSKGGVS